MKARHLISDLRRRGVVLEVDGERLCVEAPSNMCDGHLRTLLMENKPAIMKILQSEQRKLRNTGRRGLVIRWSSEPGWIALHDPRTGEWHEVQARECLPGVVEAANASRRPK